MQIPWRKAIPQRKWLQTSYDVISVNVNDNISPFRYSCSTSANCCNARGAPVFDIETGGCGPPPRKIALTGGRTACHAISASIAVSSLNLSNRPSRFGKSVTIPMLGRIGRAAETSWNAWHEIVASLKRDDDCAVCIERIPARASGSGFSTAPMMKGQESL